MPSPTLGPFCQSCGMPLDKAADFGTAATGLRVNEYCHFCYEHGRFTDPDLTMDRMVDKCVALMVSKSVMPEREARTLMSQVIPRLGRWRRGADRDSAR